MLHDCLLLRLEISYHLIFDEMTKRGGGTYSSWERDVGEYVRWIESDIIVDRYINDRKIDNI